VVGGQILPLKPENLTRSQTATGQKLPQDLILTFENILELPHSLKRKDGFIRSRVKFGIVRPRAGLFSMMSSSTAWLKMACKYVWVRWTVS